MRDVDVRMKFNRLRVTGIKARQFDGLDEVFACLTHQQILEILNRHERDQKYLEVYRDLRNGRVSTGVTVEHR